MKGRARADADTGVMEEYAEATSERARPTMQLPKSARSQKEQYARACKTRVLVVAKEMLPLEPTQPHAIAHGDTLRFERLARRICSFCKPVQTNIAELSEV